MKFGKDHHLHLIDGSAFIFRAYHALPPLTRSSDGLPGRGTAEEIERQSSSQRKGNDYASERKAEQDYAGH